MAKGDTWDQTDEGQQVSASWEYLTQTMTDHLTPAIDTLNTMANRPL